MGHPDVGLETEAVIDPGVHGKADDELFDLKG